jgi:hypothetical protein
MFANVRSDGVVSGFFNAPAWREPETNRADSEDAKCVHPDYGPDEILLFKNDVMAARSATLAPFAKADRSRFLQVLD